MSMSRKLTIIKLLKYCMIPFGSVYSLFHRKSNLTILLYHRVDDAVCKEISVTTDNFRWQMEYLRQIGYRVVTLDDAANPDWIQNIDQSKKYVVLTFDDGYTDFYSTAYPILKEYNYPSTLYLVPSAIEAGKVFWWDQDLGESSLLSWEQAMILRDSGIVQIGSHSMSHADFNKINESEVEAELELSQKALQEALSIDIRHFSYPRGIVTQTAREIVKKYYDTAVSIFDGYEITPQCSVDHLMQISRLPVQRSDGRYLFAARLKGWLALEGWIKRYLIRY